LRFFDLPARGFAEAGAEDEEPEDDDEEEEEEEEGAELIILQSDGGNKQKQRHGQQAEREARKARKKWADRQRGRESTYLHFE
jgi:hypothetical protein